jgi:hypothetical protein
VIEVLIRLWNETMTVVGELSAFIGALNPQWVLLGVASLAALIAWRSAHLHIRRVQQLEC